MLAFSDKFGDEFYNHEVHKKNIGVSSLKILDGEDLNFGNRKRQNQLQQKRWLDQQMNEKREKERINKQEKHLFDTQQTDINSKWGVLNEDHESRRKDMRVACRETLDEQIREKLERDSIDRQLSDQQSQGHINTCLNDDFYNENTDTCKSHVSDTRVLKYHWKGMNEDQRHQIQLEQERMRKDRHELEELQKDEQRLWDKQQEKVRRNLIIMQRQHGEARKQVEQDTIGFNKYKAMEDSQRAKIIYDNVHFYKM